MTTINLECHNRCFGYARVSTDDQDLSLQIDALIRFGIDGGDIFSDKVSGAKEDRAGLSKCLNTLPLEIHCSFGDLIGWAAPCVTS